MNTPIPVGLIGLGRHGIRYLSHLTANNTGGKLIAISRQQEYEGRQQARQNQVLFFKDYRNLIADSTIQAIIVVTPAALHLPIGLEAIKHRKAVLIEKPLTVNTREGINLVESAKKAGIPLMTGHTLRYEPVIRTIQDLIPSLGTWQSVRGTMHLEEQPENQKRHGIQHGVLSEIGIHLLDWVRMIMPTDPLSVSTNLTRASPTAPETRAQITLTTPSGLSCHLDVAKVRGKRVTHMEIIGTKGRIRGDWTNGIVQTYEHETLTSQETIPATPTIIFMLKEFFQAIQTGQPMPISGEDGLRAVELAEACYQSAETGQSINIP